MSGNIAQREVLPHTMLLANKYEQAVRWALVQKAELACQYVILKADPDSSASSKERFNFSPAIIYPSKKEDYHVFTEYRAAKPSGNHMTRSHSDSFIRMVLRSIPFIGFLLIAVFAEGITTWSLERKAIALILVPMLISLSVYLWWPRNR